MLLPFNIEYLFSVSGAISHGVFANYAVTAVCGGMDGVVDDESASSVTHVVIFAASWCYSFHSQPGPLASDSTCSLDRSERSPCGNPLRAPNERVLASLERKAHQPIPAITSSIAVCQRRQAPVITIAGPVPAKNFNPNRRTPLANPVSCAVLHFTTPCARIR